MTKKGNNINLSPTSAVISEDNQKKIKMKKIVLGFLFFTTLIFAQNQNSQRDKSHNNDSKKIIKELKKDILLTQEQEDKLVIHLNNKMTFYQNTELSDVRKQAVLNAYKEEFDRILGNDQVLIINRKNKDLYLEITESY
jgi:hypothetical protein